MYACACAVDYPTGAEELWTRLTWKPLKFRTNPHCHVMSFLLTVRPSLIAVPGGHVLLCVGHRVMGGQSGSAVGGSVGTLGECVPLLHQFGAF